MLQRLLIVIVSVLLLSGCAPYFHQPFGTERARLGAEINKGDELRNLPVPKLRTVVAVYKFRDQTGQYKPTTNGASFSTAVTQGATTILLKALEESNWFDPIERENLGNLLNERKIIRSTRAEYAEQTGQKQPLLAPLLFAGVIMEGGIISYDANMLTGGAGLRYFGAGASGQYRQDRVTVYLRAISTSNGRILKTIYTTKTILSQQVDASLFRFVRFQRLLETETGFTYNEPSEMAVKDAIEKSVQAMVYEGIQEGMWAVRDSAELRGPRMLAYLTEKDQSLHFDALGRQIIERQGALAVGFTAGAQRYSGDFADALTRPGGEITVRYQKNGGKWASFANLGRMQLATRQYFNQTLNYAEAGIQYRVLPYDRLMPCLAAGAGITTRDIPSFSATNGILPHIMLGVGAEYFYRKRLSFTFGIDNHIFLNDQVDLTDSGKYNDYYWSGRLGVLFYLNGATQPWKSRVRAR